LLRKTCDTLGVKMIAGPHCYSFFEGNLAFAAREELTAFYLTDFLVRQFDAFVIKPLGLDRHPELRDMYFGNYTKLHAARLGLTFERRSTGYGDLENTLKTLT